MVVDCSEWCVLMVCLTVCAVAWINANGKKRQ